jgi:PEP-CTERM motif
MKTTALLLAACSIATTGFADSRDHMPSATQRITSFMSGGINPNTSVALQQNGRVTLPTVSLPNYSFNWAGSQQNNVQWNSADFSALFETLRTDVANHNFDQAFSDLQQFVNNLHLDPALTSKLEALFQDLENGRCDKFGLMNSGNDDDDENADNDNDQDEDQDMDEDEGAVQVPEPSTVAMLVSGAALLAGTFLRRRVR